MDALLKDFKLGLRALAKKPASSAIAILAFGLGIGLCATMFSLIYGIYFRGIGVPEADRLALIYRTNPSENIDRMGVDQHDFYDWREQQRVFEAIAGFSSGTINVSGPTDEPIRYDGAFVTANVFDVLRKPPVLGTSFRPGDDAPGAPMTVLIGYDVWTSRYNSDPDVIGQTTNFAGHYCKTAAIFAGLHPELRSFLGIEKLDRKVSFRRLRRTLLWAAVEFGEVFEGIVPAGVYTEFLDACYLDGLAEGLH